MEINFQTQIWLIIIGYYKNNFYNLFRILENIFSYNRIFILIIKIIQSYHHCHMLDSPKQIKETRDTWSYLKPKLLEGLVAICLKGMDSSNVWNVRRRNRRFPNTIPGHKQKFYAKKGLLRFLISFLMTDTGQAHFISFLAV